MFLGQVSFNGRLTFNFGEENYVIKFGSKNCKMQKRNVVMGYNYFFGQMQKLHKHAKSPTVLGEKTLSIN